MRRNIKVGITACSNGLPLQMKAMEWQLKEKLEELEIIPVFSEYIYESDGERSGTAVERAGALMEFYDNPEIYAILDISGGDIANEILPCLDFQKIADARSPAGGPKQFWGYSDLTVLLNGIYAKTGNSGVLYQARHLLDIHDLRTLEDFRETVLRGNEERFKQEKNSLFGFTYSFVQGEELSGVTVGGNIRCLLKLAGTEYFPDLTGKILFLEARSGLQPQMIACLGQLKQLGAFDRIRGVLLGTFTQLEEERGKEKSSGRMTRNGQDVKKKSMEQLVGEFAGESMPIVKTTDIGHAIDSKALLIGKPMNLRRH